MWYLYCQKMAILGQTASILSLGIIDMNRFIRDSMKKNQVNIPFLFLLIILLSSGCNGGGESVKNSSTSLEEHLDTNQSLADTTATGSTEQAGSPATSYQESGSSAEQEGANVEAVDNGNDLPTQADLSDLINGDLLEHIVPTNVVPADPVPTTSDVPSNTEQTSNTENSKNNKIVLNKIAAFPTAYGAGAVATGGRGGDVVYVTNRNSSGRGSFREALTNADPNRATTIMFAIGGQFDIGSHPTDPDEASIYLVGKNNITIAGQTANDLGGVNIMSSSPKDGRIYLDRSENFIIRYASFQGQAEKFQYGDKGKYSPLSLVQTNTVILDHFTGGYGSYGVSVGGYNINSKKASEVTIQNSLFHENVGNHNVSLIAGMMVTSFGYSGSFPDVQAKLNAWNTLKSDEDLHHNAYILNSHRQPGNLEGGKAGSIKAISNYIYGWGERTTAGAGSLKADLINNVYEQNRVGTVAANKFFKHHFEDNDKILDVSNPPAINPSYFIAGNQVLENNGTVFLEAGSAQWHTISDANDHHPLSKKYQRSQPQPNRIHPIPVTATVDVKKKVLANAGAGTRYNEDGSTNNINAIDNKYISIAKKKSGPDALTNNIFPYDKPDGKLGDPSTFSWPTYGSKKRNLESYDSDRDGLPDAWEALHKVSEANAKKTNWLIQGYEVINNAGYTNLDIFLAELAGDFHILANQ